MNDARDNPASPPPLGLRVSDAHVRAAYRDYLEACDRRDAAAQRWVEAESDRQQTLAKYTEAYRAAYGEKP